MSGLAKAAAGLNRFFPSCVQAFPFESFCPCLTQGQLIPISRATPVGCSFEPSSVAGKAQDCNMSYRRAADIGLLVTSLSHTLQHPNNPSLKPHPLTHPMRLPSHERLWMTSTNASASVWKAGRVWAECQSSTAQYYLAAPSKVTLYEKSISCHLLLRLDV